MYWRALNSIEPSASCRSFELNFLEYDHFRGSALTHPLAHRVRPGRQHEEIFHGARLSVIHAIPAGDPSLPIQLGLGEQAESAEKREARRRIEELQRTVGSEALFRIAVGPVKEVLVEEARRSDADLLVIGRSAQSEAGGHMRDLTYAMVRDSPCPVASV